MLKKYEITLKSTSPLIPNVIQKPVEDEKKELKKDQLAEWEEKNWKKRAEYENGKVILPFRWFRANFIGACQKLKLVPHFATRKNETYTNYARSIIFEEGNFSLVPSKLKKLEAYMGNPGSMTTVKILKIYPVVEEWKTTFIITDPMGRMKKEEMEQIFEYGGIILGVGDWRSQNYGRFKVVGIKEK